MTDKKLNWLILCNTSDYFLRNYANIKCSEWHDMIGSNHLRQTKQEAYEESFRNDSTKYIRVIKEFLIELREIYDSGLRFNTPQGDRLTDFKSFVSFIRDKPTIIITGRGFLNGFEIRSEQGVEIGICGVH